MAYAAPRRYDHDEAVRRYLEGESLTQIATAFGVSHVSILQTLKRRGVPRRSLSEARQLRSPPIQHGTEGGYSRRGCRCGECRAAATAAKRARREKTRKPCSHGCGRLVDTINRSNPSKSLECRSCARRRVAAEQKSSRVSVSFTVYGVAKPAGSKRAFAHKSTGRIVVTDANKNSRPWKNDVAQAAGDAMRGAPLLEGPLELVVRFYIPRPKGHFGKRGLKPSAPAWPTVKPDATKLLRAVEDACTGIVWRDDAQVVVQHVSKEYGEPARCAVGVAPIELERTLEEGAAA